MTMALPQARKNTLAEHAAITLLEKKVKTGIFGDALLTQHAPIRLMTIKVYQS
jgi:hypothetical protein